MNNTTPINNTNPTKSVLSTIEQAVEDFKLGKMIIVVDDEDRENEGDFVCAAELITPEMVNFMLHNGRGVLCVPITADRCEELEMEMMASNNTSMLSTPFTISVDLLGDGCTTGVAATDRAKTIRALANPLTKPEELGRPGHIFPLRAQNKGVLRRAGHTEAAVDLARLAGLQPAGALIEIMNEDGTMARMPELIELSKKFDMKIISIADLIAYRIKAESIVEKGETVNFPTQWGDFKLTAFKQKSNGLEHLVLTKGEWNADEAIPVRMHSSCLTGDVFGSCRCDCGDQLHQAMKLIEQEGKGALVYLNQEGRGIGFFNKMKAYKLQEQGMDTIQANVQLGFKADERDYGVGANILREINICKLKLMTNNPLKRAGLEGYGIEILEIVPLVIQPNKFNEKYLQTKEKNMGHKLGLFTKGNK